MPRDPKALLERVDALVLTGGPDVDPELYGEAAHRASTASTAPPTTSKCAVADVAIARGIPMLAICRGIQVLNVARGGTLYQHIPEDPGVPAHGQPGEAGGARVHDVTLEPDSLVADVMDTTTRDRRRATTIKRSRSSATACASSAAPPTASSKRSSSTARSCSRCSGTPRTPRPTTPHSNACSTRSSANPNCVRTASSRLWHRETGVRQPSCVREHCRMRLIRG